MAKEEKVGSHYYKIGKLSAMKQGRVAFGVAPLLTTGASEAVPIIWGLVETGRIKNFADFFNLPVMDMVMLLQPIGSAMGTWEDRKREEVMATLLSCVERKTESGSWAPIWNEASGMAMFDDLNYDFWTQAHIAILSFRENVLGFFLERLQTSVAE